MVYSELDHYRPPVHNSEEREYTLMDKVHRILQGLRPKFENLKSQLCNWENPLCFEDVVSQLISEESRLQDMKGSNESSAYVVTAPRGTPPGQQGHKNSNTTKKSQTKSKNNLWCNFYKRRGHVKETFWKLHGRPP